MDSLLIITIKLNNNVGYFILEWRPCEVIISVNQLKPNVTFCGEKVDSAIKPGWKDTPFRVLVSVSVKRKILHYWSPNCHPKSQNSLTLTNKENKNTYDAYMQLLLFQICCLLEFWLSRAQETTEDTFNSQSNTISNLFLSLKDRQKDYIICCKEILYLLWKEIIGHLWQHVLSNDIIIWP